MNRILENIIYELNPKNDLDRIKFFGRYRHYDSNLKMFSAAMREIGTYALEIPKHGAIGAVLGAALGTLSFAIDSITGNKDLSLYDAVVIDGLIGGGIDIIQFTLRYLYKSLKY